MDLCINRHFRIKFRLSARLEKTPEINPAKPNKISVSQTFCVVLKCNIIALCCISDINDSTLNPYGPKKEGKNPDFMACGRGIAGNGNTSRCG